MAKKYPTELEQLITDYNNDNAYIRRQMFKWLEPREKIVRKLPSKSDMEEMEAKKDNESKAEEKKEMSPVLQVMKAVTDRALNPKHKKVPKDVKTKSEKQEPGSRAKKSSQLAKG